MAINTDSKLLPSFEAPLFVEGKGDEASCTVSSVLLAVSASSKTVGGKYWHLEKSQTDLSHPRVQPQIAV